MTATYAANKKAMAAKRALHPGERVPPPRSNPHRLMARAPPLKEIPVPSPALVAGTIDRAKAMVPLATRLKAPPKQTAMARPMAVL